MQRQTSSEKVLQGKRGIQLSEVANLVLSHWHSDGHVLARSLIFWGASPGIQEFHSLLEQEGFSNPYFLGRLCQAILEGQLLSSDADIVRHLADLARQSFLICEGENSDRLLQLEPFDPNEV